MEGIDVGETVGAAMSQGSLSDAQLETCVVAASRHQMLLPGGSRAAFFLGDGAGVGKVRAASARARAAKTGARNAYTRTRTVLPMVNTPKLSKHSLNPLVIRCGPDLYDVQRSLQIIFVNAHNG